MTGLVYYGFELHQLASRVEVSKKQQLQLRDDRDAEGEIHGGRIG